MGLLQYLLHMVWHHFLTHEILPVSELWRPGWPRLLQNMLISLYQDLYFKPYFPWDYDLLSHYCSVITQNRLLKVTTRCARYHFLSVPCIYWIKVFIIAVGCPVHVLNFDLSTDLPLAVQKFGKTICLWRWDKTTPLLINYSVDHKLNGNHYTWMTLYEYQAFNTSRNNSLIFKRWTHSMYVHAIIHVFYEVYFICNENLTSPWSFK